MKNLSALILGLFVGFYKAYIMSYFWLWFIVPIFGLPVISALHFCGITVTYSFLSYNIREEDKDRTLDETIHLLIYIVIYQTAFFGMGYLLSWFV